MFGPNGFFRHFRGTLASTSPANLNVEVVYDPILSTLLLRIKNQASATSHVRITNAYDDRSFTHVIPKGLDTDIAWPLVATFGWYDLSITSSEDPNFLQRLSGHLENGLPSFSDPALGTGSPQGGA